MDNYQKLIVELLKSLIHSKEPDLMDDFLEIDLDTLYLECVAHQVHTLVYPSIKDYYRNTILEKEKLLSQWEENVVKSVAVQYQNSLLTFEILRKLNESGIPVISLKGLILRELYPYPEMRIMGDIDLLVKKEDLDKTEKILLDSGFRKNDSDNKHSVFENRTRLIIEVHLALADDINSNGMIQFTKDVWENAILYKFNASTTSLILSELHQILYLCLHMAGHMSKEGFGLRQLCDLVIYIENYGNNIDWTEFYRVAGQLGICSFSKAIIAVCYRLFSMKSGPECTNISNNDKEFIKRLEEDIFSSGVFGNKTLERVMGNKLMRYSGQNSNDSLGDRLRSLIFLIFPPPSRLTPSYSYAQRHYFLVPVAWVHRLIYTVFRRDISIRDKSITSFSKSARDAYKERSELLNWLGLK